MLFKLLRVKHYIKNFFIFIPLVFSLSFYDFSDVKLTLISFACFCLVVSCVYIVNDCKDVEQDRNHPIKKKRPIASGKISVQNAYILALSLLLIASFVSYLFLSYKVLIVLYCYLFMNILYTLYLKKIALVDVMVIAIGFILRIYAGSFAIGVEVSNWLLLTTLSLSLFLGFGKRIGEYRKNKDKNTRVSLNFYTEKSLQMFLNVTLTTSIVFYSLYTIFGQTHIKNLVYTVPFVFLGFFRYYLLLESNVEDGDPTEVLTNDKMVMAVILGFCITVGFLLLFNGA